MSISALNKTSSFSSLEEIARTTTITKEYCSLALTLDISVDYP